MRAKSPLPAQQRRDFVIRFCLTPYQLLADPVSAFG
jgi:hypothetical protein